MNFKHLIFTTYVIAVVSSIATKDTGKTETFEQQKLKQQITYQKPLEIEQFNFEQAVNHQAIGSKIITKFTPKDSQEKEINLTQLSAKLGYDHFNWVSYVESDPHGISDRTGKLLATPYIDPPMGGYEYDAADRLPFYWDMVHCDRCTQRYNFRHPRNSTPTELTFLDAPADYRLQPGEAIEFITNLVGVTSYDRQQQKAEWEVLHTFRWQLVNIHANYNQVLLVDANVSSEQLSPELITLMAQDGAVSLPQVRVSTSDF